MRSNVASGLARISVVASIDLVPASPSRPSNTQNYRRPPSTLRSCSAEVSSLSRQVPSSTAHCSPAAYSRGCHSPLSLFVKAKPCDRLVVMNFPRGGSLALMDASRRPLLSASTRSDKNHRADEAGDGGPLAACHLRSLARAEAVRRLRCCSWSQGRAKGPSASPNTCFSSIAGILKVGPTLRSPAKLRSRRASAASHLLCGVLFTLVPRPSLRRPRRCMRR